jgi:hypothetical protein
MDTYALTRIYVSSERDVDVRLNELIDDMQLKGIDITDIKFSAAYIINHLEKNGIMDMHERRPFRLPRLSHLVE